VKGLDERILPRNRLELSCPPIVVSKKLSFESYDCLQEDCNWERSSVPHSTFIEDEVIGHQDFWRRKDDLLGEIFEIGNSLSC